MIVTKQTLPKGWRWIKLEELAKLQSGGTPSRGNLKYYGGIIPWAKIQDLTKAGKWISSTEEYITEAALQESSAQVFPEMTVLFAMYGSIGTCSIAQKPISTNQAILGCICGDALLPEYLYYWFFFNKEVFLKMGRGGTQANLNARIVKSLEIPLPPLDEQKRIAARLNEQMRHVEQARQAAEESLSAAWELPSAYLKNAFESTDAQNWKTVKLGEILASTKNGLYKLDKYYGRGKPILKMYNIGRLDGTWNLERVDYIELTDNEYEDYRLDKGDILINRVNSRELVGKCAVINEKVDGAVYESKNIRIRLERERAEPEFVAAYINSKYGRDQFERSLKQIVGQATINRSDLDAFEIPLAPLDIQKQLMKSLNSKQENARALAASLESQLAEINELPSALLRQAFAGNI